MATRFFPTKSHWKGLETCSSPLEKEHQKARWNTAEETPLLLRTKGIIIMVWDENLYFMWSWSSNVFIFQCLIEILKRIHFQLSCCMGVKMNISCLNMHWFGYHNKKFARIVWKTHVFWIKPAEFCYMSTLLIRSCLISRTAISQEGAFKEQKPL